MEGIVEMFIEVVKWVFVIAVAFKGLHYLENTADDTHRTLTKVEEFINSKKNKEEKENE